MLLEILEHYAIGVKQPSEVLIPTRRKKFEIVTPNIWGHWQGMAVKYDMILVRSDGWSLGFSRDWKNVAMGLCLDWIALIDTEWQIVERFESPAS